MKTILTAAALIALSFGGAVAGEGNGDPFALHTSGVTTQVGPQPARTSPATAYTASRATPAYARLLPDNASMAIAQTPNSLPRAAAN